jgi:hypothetical protein
LPDYEFFNAHTGKDIRYRRVIPGELPRSLQGRPIREVEVRRLEPGVLLLRFIDADGGWIPMLPVFDPDMFLTLKGRRRSCRV